MGYAGYNISSSASDFVPKDINYLESTATPKNIQINLAIMRDTLEVPFSELNKHETWKYPSSSARPTLPPVYTLRTANSESQEADAGDWQSRYEELLEELPIDIKNAIIMNKELERSQQFASLLAFDYSLIALAKAVATLESAADATAQKNTAKARKEINEQITGYIQDNYGIAAVEILSSIKEKLAQLGRNHADYESVSYYTSLSEEGVRALINKRAADE